MILPSDTSWISSEAPRATAAGGISNVAMSRFSEASSLSRPLANFAAPLVVFFSKRRYSSRCQPVKSGSFGPAKSSTRESTVESTSEISPAMGSMRSHATRLGA